MGDSIWALIGIITGIGLFIIRLLVLIVTAVLVFMAATGAYNSIVAGWPPDWRDAAIVLVLACTIVTWRRGARLEKRIEQLQLAGFATVTYLDVVPQNPATEIRGFGPLMRHGFARLFYRLIGHGDLGDDILHTYGARDGKRVTLADDLNARLRPSVAD